MIGAAFKESLGTFGDKYCGDTEIPFEFHLQSRDMIAAATAAAVAASAVAVTAAASAAVATTATDDCTTTSVDSDSVASDIGMQVPSPSVKSLEPPLPPAPPKITLAKSAIETKGHDAQLRSAYREAMVWNQDAVTAALKVGSVDRTAEVANIVSAFIS